MTTDPNSNNPQTQRPSEPVQPGLKVQIPVKWTIIGIVLAMTAVVLYYGGCSGKEWKLRNTTAGKITVTDISPVQKLKVSTYYKEVMAVQWRESNGFFSTTEDQLCLICPARLDLGIDLAKCGDDWYEEHGDTVWATFPPIEVLNKDAWLVDEVNRRVPIERGSWSDAEKSELVRRLNAAMLQRCEAEGCWTQAEVQARLSLQNIFASLGKNNVHINFRSRPRKADVTLSESAMRREEANPYRYFINLQNERSLVYRDGGMLIYDGLSYEQLFAFARLYYSFDTRDPYIVSLQGHSLTLSHVSNRTSLETASNWFSKLFDSDSRESNAAPESERTGLDLLFTVIRRDIFLSDPSLRITYRELDRNKTEIWRYEK